MKNLKILIAFVAGFAISRLFKIDFNLPTFNLSAEQSTFLGTIALTAAILAGAFFLNRIREGSDSSSPVSAFFRTLRNLHKSERDCYLGGVCGGLGEATRVPSYIWRLLFAVSFFFFGAGFWTYFLLWLFLPDSENLPAESAPQTGNFFDFLLSFKRSNSDHCIGGVCGGLGKATPAPSWLWRRGFVVLNFAFGCGLLIYLLLWIFVPAEEEDSRDHIPT